jgi:hypothetical protein
MSSSNISEITQPLSIRNNYRKQPMAILQRQVKHVTYITVLQINSSYQQPNVSKKKLFNYVCLKFEKYELTS